MKWLIILFSAGFMSCSVFNSPQKRLARLIALNPDLQRDTVWIETIITEIDTFIVDSLSVDTLVVTQPIDTITLTKDNLIVRVVRHYDTLWLEGNLTADTIIRTDTIRVLTPVITERIVIHKRFPWWILIVLIIGAGVVWRITKK